jgi:hypothetical protein
VTDESPVWLTPAEVRAEVSALRRIRAFTNADLARAVLGDAFTQSRYQLVGKFLNTGGEFGGANQDVYAPMARYVEKCRVALGKPKSKKRVALEAETKPGRQPFLGSDPNRKYLAPASAKLFLKKYHIGRTVIGGDWY